MEVICWQRCYFSYVWYNGELLCLSILRGEKQCLQMFSAAVSTQVLVRNVLHYFISPDVRMLRLGFFSLKKGGFRQRNLVINILAMFHDNTKRSTAILFMSVFK